MNKFRTTLMASAAGAALLAGLAAVTPAQADPLAGVVGTEKFQFTNFESFFTPTGGTDTAISVGDVNAGIFIVSSVTKNGGASTVFTSGQNNDYLVGIFSNITVAQYIDGSGNTVSAPVAGGSILNTGGTFSLYLVNSATYASTWGTVVGQGTSGFTNNGCTGYTTLCYNGISNVGTELLSFNLAAGVSYPASPTTTLLVNGVSTATNPPTGSGLGYGDVVPGSGLDAAAFNNNGQAGGTDMQLKDEYCVLGVGQCLGSSSSIASTGDWLLRSSDPILTGEVAVPEPATIALFGSGLLGLGMARRRKNKNKKA